MGSTATTTTIARKLRVLASINVGPAYAVRVTEYDIALQGSAEDGMPEHLASLGLERCPDKDHDGFEVWTGVIDGVPVRGSSSGVR